MKVPQWAQDRRDSEKSVLNRAARVAILYAIRDKLPDIPKTTLAHRMGISRWTLDRDLVSLAEADQQIGTIIESIITLKEKKDE